jgi:hypothetical protein
MRVLVGRIDNRFSDVGSLAAALRARILAPDSYADSQPFGARLREEGSNGVTYESVRDPGGHCVGAFRPRAIGRPVQSKHLMFHWDGARVARYFDHEDDRWVAL